jgi:hypothetical protein
VVTELERLVRELLDAWNAWMDADGWSGAELDRLAEIVEQLRAEMQKP